MPTRKSISSIISDIARTKIPTMVIDTCVSFDIVRCAWRGNGRVVGIANQLIEAQLNGELLLYCHSALQVEAARNRAEVEGEAQKKAAVVDQTMTQYRDVAKYLGIRYPHASDYIHGSVISLLMALHDRLLETCIHIEPEEKIQLAAFFRGSNNRRPARKGGGANDCLMFEEFRSIANALPSADPLVLLTTNPDDFEDRSKAPGVIHHEISDDLAGTRAQLCLNWDWAAKLVLSEARLKSI